MDNPIDTKILLTELQEALEFHRDDSQAVPMAKYMKHQFRFLGIKQPARKALSREFISSATKELPMKAILLLADRLWEQDEREYQYIAMELLLAAKKQWDAKTFRFFLALITRKPWWDTVDFIATKLVGGYYATHPDPEKMLAWARSTNIWQNRTAILFQLTYKNKTSTGLLFTIIRLLYPRKDFFIQKAIGWSLRQYHRTDSEKVLDFIETEGITGLARREALKHER